MPSHEQVKNGNALKFVKDYWFIVLFIVSISFGWATLEARINELTQDRFYGKDGVLLQQQIDVNKAGLQRMDTALIRIENKIDLILQNGN